jgi:DNA-binding beta-propeller fold protein YncE
MLAAIAAALAITPIPIGGAPCGNVYAFGSIWVTGGSANAVFRVDPGNNRRVGALRVGAEPCGIVAGAGSLWVEDFGDATVERINPHTLKVIARIRAGRHVWDVLFAAGSIWASNSENGAVERISTRSNKVTRVIKTGGRPANLAFAVGAVWVGSNTGQSIFRIDPATNKATAISIAQDGPASITADPGGTDLWVSNRNAGTVSRYSIESHSLLATIMVGRGPAVSAVAADGTLVVPNGDDGSLSRIDRATNTVTETVSGLGEPLIVRSWLGDLWVGDNRGSILYRLHSG